MFNKIFKPQSTGLAALILTLASVLSYVMGMVRDIVFADYYGAGLTTDAYNASFLIPDAIFNLFVAGALTAAFIPVFSSYLWQKDKQEAETLAGSFLSLASLVVVIVGLVAYIFMPDLISWYFLNTSSEKIELTVTMSRILLLSPLLFAISNTLGNILLSHKQFVSYAIAPLFYNLGIIIGIVFFSARFGIYAAAWGAVFGILLHLLSRFIEILSLDFRLSWHFDFFHPGMLKIFWLMIPKTIGLMSWQVSLWMINFIGNAGLASGSVSVFYYARNLQSFPVSIFGIALATAVFPYLSDHVAAGRKEFFTHQYEKSLRQILFLTLPAAIGIYMLANPIVAIIYGHGAFDSEDTRITAIVLTFFALSIPLESMVHLMARAFYAHKNTLVPVVGSLMLMLSVITGSYFFAPRLGAPAFALFFTIGSAIQVFWLVLMLRNRISGFDKKAFFLSFIKVTLASISMAATIQILDKIAPFSLIITLFLQILFGAATFFVFSILLKCEELNEAKNIIYRQLKKKFVTIYPQNDEKK